MYFTDPDSAPSAPVLNLQRPVRIGLPFAIYEFQLRHRLLENLQAVSRFLLRALARGATIDTIVAVTALSAETINAQCEYLRYQGYLNGSLSLTGLGEEVVALERLLPGCVKRVGIDKFSGRNIFVLPTDEMEEPDVIHAGGLPDARLSEERHMKQFDHQSRVAEILIDNNGKGLLDFTNYFWPEHNALFAGQLRYLDFGLRPLDRHPAELLSVDIDCGRLTPVQKLRPREAGIALPVLEISRSFEMVPGWPWPVTVPESDSLYVDLFSHASLPPGLPLVDVVDSQVPLLADGEGQSAPDLLPVCAPAGASARHELRRRYLNLRLDGSLMEMVHAEYGFLILGDAHA